MKAYIDRVLDGYTDCALWSSIDSEGNPLDGLGLSISAETLAGMRADVARFLAQNDALCTAALECPGYTFERLGHDLWLTRNRHGAGYWDRAELEIPYVDGTLGRALTDAAHGLGECYLVVGDSGEIEDMEGGAA